MLVGILESIPKTIDYCELFGYNCNIKVLYGNNSKNSIFK